MQIGHSSRGGTFPTGPMSSSLPTSSLPPRLSSSVFIRLHSILCSLRCLFWQSLSQYQTHLHPLHIFRVHVSLSSPHAEQNNLVGVVPFSSPASSIFSASTFLSVRRRSAKTEHTKQRQITSRWAKEPSCSAAAAVPSAMVAVVFVEWRVEAAKQSKHRTYVCVRTYEVNRGQAPVLDKNLFVKALFCWHEKYLSNS